MKVLVTNLNCYCLNDDDLSFRYVSNFWDKMKFKYKDINDIAKLNLLNYYKGAVQNIDCRRIYSVLIYFLNKQTTNNDNIYPKKTDHKIEYYNFSREIDKELFENSNIKVNTAEFE